jgi:hypothetical protein
METTMCTTSPLPLQPQRSVSIVLWTTLELLEHLDGPSSKSWFVYLHYTSCCLKMG